VLKKNLWNKKINESILKEDQSDFRMIMQFKNNNLRAVRAVSAFMFLALTPSAVSPSAQFISDSVSPPDGSIASDTRSSADPFIAHAGDSSIPFPILLSWKLQGNYTSPSYDIYLSERRRFDSTDIIAHDLSETRLPVWNLKIDTRYYWWIAIKSNKSVVRITRRFSFTTAAQWPRMIYLDGTTNVRDIGGRINGEGRRVRQGLYYRSAEFNQNYNITQLGISQVIALGMACEIDLRNNGENPQAVLPPSIRYFRPVSDIGGLVAYQYGLQNYGNQYRDVFKILAKSENYPVICHCMAGADRAGTVAALIEALIGYTEKQMAEDYQWTSLSVNGIRDSTSYDWRSTMAEIKSYDTVHGTVQKGAWNYLLAKGVTAEELSAIRHIMLYPHKGHFNGRIDSMNKNRLDQPAVHAVRYVFMGSDYVNFPYDMNTMAVFSLSGKKIFEFDRMEKTGNLKVPFPGSFRGIGIVRFSKKRGRG
jgi:hypothetical protein